MLFIQVFCVFTFLVFCLDFYLYNRESLKTKLLQLNFLDFTVFFVFFSVFGSTYSFDCFFFQCTCISDVYVCSNTVKNFCSCPNAILL